MGRILIKWVRRGQIALLAGVLFFSGSIASAGEWDAGLVEAVDRKDIVEAQKLLQRGADANARDALGFPVLMTAARRGSVELVQLLIDHGAYVDLEAQDPFFLDFAGATALMWAAEDGEVEIVKLLLEHGADVDFWSETYIPTALLRAAANGQADVVRVLLDSGAYIDQSVDGKTGLFFAAQEGYREVVKVLLDYGADVGAKQREVMRGAWGPKGQEKFVYTSSILMQAAQQGDLAVAHMLLDKGANINEVDACGVSALMFTTRRGHADVARLLLNSGADPNIKAFKRDNSAETLCGVYPETTALILAARDSHATEIARILLAKGANLEVVDGRGWTALMHACDKGYLDLARLFVKHGARVNVKSGPYTPFYLAESRDYQDILKLLIKAGAKKPK